MVFQHQLSIFYFPLQFIGQWKTETKVTNDLGTVHKKHWKAKSFSALQTVGSVVNLWCGITSFRCRKKAKHILKLC